MKEMKTKRQPLLIIRKPSRNAQRDAKTLLRILQTYPAKITTIDGSCSLCVHAVLVEDDYMKLELVASELRLHKAFERYARGVMSLICADYMKLQRRIETAKCHAISAATDWREFTQGIKRLSDSLAKYRPSDTQPKPRA